MEAMYYYNDPKDGYIDCTIVKEMNKTIDVLLPTKNNKKKRVKRDQVWHKHRFIDIPTNFIKEVPLIGFPTDPKILREGAFIHIDGRLKFITEFGMFKKYSDIREAIYPDDYIEYPYIVFMTWDEIQENFK